MKHQRDEIVVKVTTVYSAILFIGVTFVFDYAFGAANSHSKEAVLEQFQSWDEQDQQDFIIASLSGKPELKREIAEDWCAINKKTQRVCWNAKLNHPIRGVK